MPRPCLPNSRLLANADSPLLPLLAPRAFAQPLFVRRTTRKHGETARKMQETEVGCGGGRHASAVSTNKQALRVDCRRGRCSNTTTTLQPSLVAGVHTTRDSRPSLAIRYADIYVLTRTYLRGYSTAESPADVQSKEPVTVSASRRGSRGRRHSARVAGSPKQVTVPVPKEGLRIRPRGVEVALRKVASDPHQIIFQKRRFRLLHNAHARFRTFMKFNGTQDGDRLATHGRYRSILRRIVALKREDIASVNLAQQKISEVNLIHAFAALDRKVYAKTKRLAAKVVLQHDPRCSWWATDLFGDAGINDEERIARKWLTIDKKTRVAYWPHLLIYLLDQMPGKALIFLRLLIHDAPSSSLRQSILADAMEHLSKIHAGRIYTGKSWAGSIDWNRDNFVPTFWQIFQAHLSSDTHSCSQELFVNIARLASIEDLKHVFGLLVGCNTYMMYDTLLTYANTFARASETECALDCLRLAAKSRTNQERRELVNRTRFRWSCALVIRKSMAKGQDHRDTARIIATIVELGVELNTLLYNAIISNAMEAGDYSTAFAVFNNLSENNLEPDAHTFSILLHGCTMAEDPSKFHDFAEHCKETAKKLQDSRLATDYLYYVYICHRQDLERPGSRGSHILSQAYLELFSHTPLDPLWNLAKLPRPSTGGIPQDGDFFEPLAPRPITLYIMLQLGIQVAANVGPANVWNLFLMFKRLVDAKYHPTINAMAQDPTIWNAFLLAFCRAQQFESASRLIKHMTDNTPRPNVYTWNIFMQGFSKAGQLRATERVYNSMHRSGVEPDQYTYGLLLKLYLRTQNFKQIGAVMELMDTEQQMDPVLLDRMARVHDRDRLVKTIEEAHKRKDERKKFEEQEARARMLARWSKPPTFSPILAAASKPSFLGHPQNNESERSGESPEADEDRRE